MGKKVRFGIISYKVMSDPSITLQAKGIYAILCLFADKNRSCYPSISTIADLADVSQRTVSRKIAELKDAKYIKRSNRKIFLV
jgi:DNA-binding MarR family transcriptional regulator|tara:strand:- start:1126 stop:1374 length:249 start_codon:yes stop_codon:yes gene_type:complete